MHVLLQAWLCKCMCGRMRSQMAAQSGETPEWAAGGVGGRVEGQKGGWWVAEMVSGG